MVLTVDEKILELRKTVVNSWNVPSVHVAVILLECIAVEITIVSMCYIVNLHYFGCYMAIVGSLFYYYDYY